MDTGKLSISAASELAGSHPEEQRRVLATVKDENGWVVLGVRKKLSKATLHALVIGVAFMVKWLELFEQKHQSRYFWPGTDDPFDFRNIFSTTK